MPVIATDDYRSAAMPSLFLAELARLLVVLHAVAAIVLVGAATHHALVAIGFLRGVYKVRLARIYAPTVAVTWLITFALGLLSYPTFRYETRAHLDRYEPWASNLFDLKEHTAALGIPLVLGAFALSRLIDPKQDRTLARAYVAIVVLVAAIVWFDVLSGLVITTTRGV